jgi:hypothetical protein
VNRESSADKLGLGQKILAAQHHLRNLGKSPADALGLFKRFERSPETFNFAAAGWSAAQFLAASKLLFLCGLRGASTKNRMSGMAAAWLATVLDEVTERQANKIINDMLPNYRIGEKLHRKGAENFGTPETRFQRSQHLSEINRDVVLEWVFVKKRPLRLLTHGKRYRAVADLYYRRHGGKKVSPKTVERSLKAF